MRIIFFAVLLILSQAKYNRLINLLENAVAREMEQMEPEEDLSDFLGNIKISWPQKPKFPISVPQMPDPMEELKKKALKLAEEAAKNQRKLAAEALVKKAADAAAKKAADAAAKAKKAFDDLRKKMEKFFKRFGFEEDEVEEEEDLEDLSLRMPKWMRDLKKKAAEKAKAARAKMEAAARKIAESAEWKKAQQKLKAAEAKARATAAAAKKALEKAAREAAEKLRLEEVARKIQETARKMKEAAEKAGNKVTDWFKNSGFGRR